MKLNTVGALTGFIGGVMVGYTADSIGQFILIIIGLTLVVVGVSIRNLGSMQDGVASKEE